QRYRDHLGTLLDLEGIAIVAMPLVWHDGLPLGGTSPLSRWADGQPLRRPLWFQSIGNTRGQAWTGLYQDADGNGIMEFASPTTPLKPGRWSHELNFIAWQPYQGKQALDLPAGARVRVSLQWREPHDPDYFVRVSQRDVYRRPLADLSLTVLRQRDPEGK